MQTPYEILGVLTDASDIEIKQAYLQQVKQNPPESDQDKFQLVHNAYSTIKDRKSRLEYELFTLPLTCFDDVIDQILKTDKATEVGAQSLDQILMACSDDASLLNTIKPEK